MKTFFCVLMAILAAAFILTIVVARIDRQRRLQDLNEAIEYSKALPADSSIEAHEDAMHRLDDARYHLTH